MLTRHTALALILMVLFGATLRAQEITVGLGAMQTPDSPQSSYAWHLDYRRSFAPNLAWSATWLNEGHVQGHHRDGLAMQLWFNSPRRIHSFVFAAGLGAYHFFDTQQQAGADSRIHRGWALIGGVSATRDAGPRWFTRLTLQRIMPEEDITVSTITAALGYRLGRDFDGPVDNPHARPSWFRRARPSYEINVLAGKTVVNASRGDRGLAMSVEYRRHFARHWDWTFSVLEEGDADVLRRRGAAAQLWFVDSWENRRFSVGLGAGFYGSIDSRRPSESGGTRLRLMHIVSPTVAWSFSGGWTARAIWHRVITEYHRDTDVFLIGLGRRW